MPLGSLAYAKLEYPSNKNSVLNIVVVHESKDLCHLFGTREKWKEGKEGRVEGRNIFLCLA